MDSEDPIGSYGFVGVELNGVKRPCEAVTATNTTGLALIYLGSH